MRGLGHMAKFLWRAPRACAIEPFTARLCNLIDHAESTYDERALNGWISAASRGTGDTGQLADSPIQPMGFSSCARATADGRHPARPDKPAGTGNKISFPRAAADCWRGREEVGARSNAQSNEHGWPCGSAQRIDRAGTLLQRHDRALPPHPD